jgi:hypothetical protein
MVDEKELIWLSKISSSRRLVVSNDRILMIGFGSSFFSSGDYNIDIAFNKDRSILYISYQKLKNRPWSPLPISNWTRGMDTFIAGNGSSEPTSLNLFSVYGDKIEGNFIVTELDIVNEKIKAEKI